MPPVNAGGFSGFSESRFPTVIRDIGLFFLSIFPGRILLLFPATSLTIRVQFKAADSLRC